MGGSIGRSAGQRSTVGTGQRPATAMLFETRERPRQKVRWRVAGGSQTGASDTERAPLQRTSWYAGGVDPCMPLPART